MYQIEQLEKFKDWLRLLKDRQAKARILIRIERLNEGNFGDRQPIGDGVSELRVRAGPGYRVYYTVHEQQIVILLCGGDKSTQKRDIELAKQLASSLTY